MMVLGTPIAHAMTALERYLAAANRKNTELSYGQATRHFEEDFGGMLPTNAETVARYLAAYGDSLSSSTLRQRLSALAYWHRSHGFADPTRDELVRKTMRGIRAVHPRVQKQATPIQLSDLERVDAHCREVARQARLANNRSAELRAVRDRALVLLGFWRAFRSDDLAKLQIEHLEIRAGEGMTLFLAASKADRANSGRTIQVPALTKLCPVEAMAEWIASSELRTGPVFRRVDRWGRPGRQAMNPKSLVPVLRRLLTEAGVDASHRYSGHSLRRGFSGWATANGWDLKTLMAYVGWRDIQSAARYVDPIVSDKQRLEAGLQEGQPPRKTKAPPVESRPNNVCLEVRLALRSYEGKTRGVSAAQRHMEQVCLARLAARKDNRHPGRYQIQLRIDDDVESLTERVSDLLDELHQVATNNNCFLEATVRDPGTGTVWD